MALESISALILDDNVNMRGVLRTILLGFGMRRIEEAAEVPHALALLASGDIDLAFVDFKLGGASGIDFCRQVRMAPGSTHTFLPIVMVTAYSERRRVMDALNAGADEFLVKPVRSVDVANRVNAIIERRRPFVKTDAYFGPDRRRRDDPGHKGPWRRSGDPGTVDI